MSTLANARSIFADALEKPALARTAFLEGACGENTALRAEIAQLLARHDQAVAAGFLGRDADSPSCVPPLVGTVTLPLSASVDANTVPHAVAAAPPLHGLPTVPGYQVVREVGRGGMAAVYAARDPGFDREVAVKVMSRGHEPRRFVVEARVTAQLSHPGVPPAHALGTLADGRPFLVMKLVQGQTLAAEMKTAGPGDRGQLLATVEAVCQTVGYAHARGVIHRDLKPTNVMVGTFGEVFVMDWGLARSRSQKGAEGQRGGCAPEGEPDATVAGQIKGTPAFMAPEQARGEPVDARADVFALGGLLAMVLTGKPPFAGGTVLDTVRRAARAEMDECLTALHQCGCERELVDVAKRCLTADPAGRYPDARAVAAALVAYRVGVEGRLRAAELARAGAEARATEQRRRRRAQLAAAAAVFLLAAGGGAAGWWADRKAAERRTSEAQVDAERRHEAERSRHGVGASLALAAELRRQSKFGPAGAALDQAARLVQAVPDLGQVVERAQADLELAIRLDHIRYRKWVYLSRPGGKSEADTAAAPERYRAALAAAGLNPAELGSNTADLISASGMRAELVAAVDDWATYEPDPAVTKRLLDVARRADPGAWTERLWDPAVRNDRAALERLAADAATVAPTYLSTLAELMRRQGLDPCPLLAAARIRYPADFELAFVHGLALELHSTQLKCGPIRTVEDRAYAEYRIALSRSWQQAISAYQSARALRPDNFAAWYNLARILPEFEDPGSGKLALASALQLGPAHAAAHYLSGYTHFREDPAKALAALREAVRLDPSYRDAQAMLGRCLGGSDSPRDWDEAVAVLRDAIRLCGDGDTGGPFSRAELLRSVGNIQLKRKDTAAAFAAYREAGEYWLIFRVYQERGDAEGMMAICKEGLSHKPEDYGLHSMLGDLYLERKEYWKAASHSRSAIEGAKAKGDDSKMWFTYMRLGRSLSEIGEREEAEAAMRRAAQLNPQIFGIIDRAPPPHEPRR